MTVPRLLASIRSASRRTAKWPERVGLAREKCAARSPAVMGFVRSKCRMCRRVGSESALKTKFIFRKLAKYRRLSSTRWKCDGITERPPLREHQTMSALGRKRTIGVNSNSMQFFYMRILSKSPPPGHFERRNAQEDGTAQAPHLSAVPLLPGAGI